MCTSHNARILFLRSLSHLNWRHAKRSEQRSRDQAARLNKEERPPRFFLTILGNDEDVGNARDERNEWRGGIPELP